MKHLGDITKIKGAEVPFVDVVCGGSPCQDLSVAGARKGLAGERSGLFMEQIRIIKELRNVAKQLSMRGADESVRPRPVRYMVWENVQGAFSSGNPKGEDFRIVLEETAKIADENAVIPRSPNGKWPSAGCIVADGWSIAYRLHDAQYWGVPQRRKRICMVADFEGQTAGKILFELQREADYRVSEPIVSDIGNEPQSQVQSLTEGLRGNNQQSRKERERAAENTEGSLDSTSYTLKIRGGVDRDRFGKSAGKGALVQTELSGTLGVSQDQTLISYGVTAKGNGDKCLNTWDVQSKHIQPENGVAESLYSGECRGGGGESYVMQEIQNVDTDSEETENKAVVYGISSYESNAMKSSNPNSGIYEAETSRTLDNNGGNPACNQGGMIVLEGNGSRPSHKGDGFSESDVSYTLNSTEHHAVCVGVDVYNQSTTGDKSKTLNSVRTDSDHVPCVCYGIDRASFNQGQNAKYDISIQEDIAQPLVARGPGGGNADKVNALCARDWKGVGNQYVSDGKLIIQRTDGI